MESLATKIYKKGIFPIIRNEEFEKVHEIALEKMRRNDNPIALNLISRYFKPKMHRRKTILKGKNNKELELEGPIGLAAGFDKNGVAIDFLSNLFDYVTVGTVLPYKDSENPKVITENGIEKRRCIRLDEKQAIINCLGFPSLGVENVLGNIANYKGTTPISISVSVKPGDSDSQNLQIMQFSMMVERISHFTPHRIKMIEANFSSPNTKGVRVFLQNDLFKELTCVFKNDNFSNTILLLKMPPHTNKNEKKANFELACRWLSTVGDGITAINTVPVKDERLTMGAGGMSGEPIFSTLQRNVHDYRSDMGNDFILNAVGGVSHKNVNEIIDMGVNTIQIYSSLVFGGPGEVRDMRNKLYGLIRN
ncbi:MAG: hypothetical protein ACP5M9_02360 [Candidatus Micrarchaeia archaeon]